MRIAILIAGQLRSLYRKKVLNNLLQNLISPLNADVFMFVNPNPIINDHNSNNLVTKEEIIQKINPIYYVEYCFTNSKDITIEGVPQDLPIFIKSAQSPDQEANVANRLYPIFWKSCRGYDLIRNYQEIIKIKYDLIIHTRPDLMYYCPIQIPIDLSANSSHIYAPIFTQNDTFHGMSDHFGIIPSDCAEIYFSVEKAARNADLLPSERPWVKYPLNRFYDSIHNIWQAWLDKHGIKWVQFYQIRIEDPDRMFWVVR